MTDLRKEAMQLLEEIPEEKLVYLIQIMQGIIGLFDTSEKEINEADGIKRAT